MARRPGPQKATIEQATEAVRRFRDTLGLTPSRVCFNADGYALEFGQGQPRPANDDLDAVLDAFEADHDEG